MIEIENERFFKNKKVWKVEDCVFERNTFEETQWKFKNFSTIQILREITFGNLCNFIGMKYLNQHKHKLPKMISRKI